MDDKKLCDRLHNAAMWAMRIGGHGYSYDIETAAARLTALATQVKELTEDRDARRTSLEQEIRETLRVRGHWSGNAESSSVITAVGLALTALAEENERLRQLLWSSREMLECAEYKDAENAQVALFVREQIEKFSEVPR